ncbi:hypothetical protein RYX36_011143, partial [Vicia faba]
ILHSMQYGYKPKKLEIVHRLWELADSEEAIIYLSDCLFVYLSGEERMEETLNRVLLKQFNPIELSTYDCGMLLICYFIIRGTQSKNYTMSCTLTSIIEIFHCLCRYQKLRLKPTPLTKLK